MMFESKPGGENGDGVSVLGNDVGVGVGASSGVDMLCEVQATNTVAINDQIIRDIFRIIIS